MGIKLDMAQVTRQLEAAGKAVSDEAMQEVMGRGADYAAQKWREVITAKGHIRTGDMRDSVGLSPEGIHKVGDGWYAEVYPQGEDREGVRNAAKAFYLHYGWKKGQKKRGSKKDNGAKGAYNGDHFVDEINASVREAFTEMVNSKITEGIKNG